MSGRENRATSARDVGARPYARTDHAVSGGFHVRAYEPGDHGGVGEILYATGFYGEDLAGAGLFDDRRLFELANTEGYLRHLPESCFVAVDDASGQVVGYVLGAPDTAAWDRVFARRMFWRIALRGFLVSWWKYPESFHHVLQWARELSDEAQRFYAEYPAHLHINVRPGCQRRGIGDALLHRYEEHLVAHKVPGVHLITSNHNDKALPFYAKHGFVVLKERPGAHYRGVPDQKAVICGKKLRG